MKCLILILMTCLLCACKESTSEFDSLPLIDQDYIRNLSNARCVATFQSAYNQFKDSSDQTITSSSDFNRGDGFYHEFKSPTATQTFDVRVWNRTATEIYFYVTEELLTTTNYFLRIKLTENEEMIDDLLADHCAKTYSASTGDSGPLTVVYEYTKPVAPNTDYYTDTYTFNFSYPAFFGSYNLSRSVKTYNSSNVQVGTTETYTSTLVAKAYTFDSVTATDSAFYTQSFCEIDFETGTTYRLSQMVKGFKFKTCVSAATGPSGDWVLTL